MVMADKLKILFFTETLVQGIGGIASYAHDFADAYPNLDIKFVCGDDYDGDKIDAMHFDGNDMSYANARRLIALINTYKPDVVVNSAFKLLTLVEPMIDDDIKVITVSHFIYGRYEAMARINAKYADSIIVLSNEAKKRLGKKLAPKTHVIYNHLPVNGRSDREWGSDLPLKVVFPGGSNRFKGAHIVFKTLLLLLKSSFDFEFYWLGNTYIAGRRYVRGAIRDIKDALPLDDRIKHVGPVDRDEAQRIISQADFFFLPSRAEGFPISLCEALAHPCLPLFSDARHGCYDIVRDGYNGYIVERDKYEANVYCELIKEGKSFKEQSRIMAEEAYATAHKLFSAERWREQMDALLNAPLNHNPRKRPGLCRYTLARIRMWWAELLDKARRKYYLLLNFLQYPFFKRAKVIKW